MGGGGWKTAPVVWGGFVVVAAGLMVAGVYFAIDRRDVWVWDVVKALGAAVAALSVGLDLRRRGRQASSPRRTTAGPPAH